MSPVPEQPNPATVPLRAAYLVQLREHAIALIWLGYGRMNAAAFSTAEEDATTGELVRQMNVELQRDDAAAPLWLEYYTVKEQVRSNTPGKLGKSRPIVDIEFERVRRGARPSLRFEAKRLGRGAGTSNYLGDEGLGAFLTGHYSRTHNEAGMLGYVQEESEAVWVGKLSAELRNRRARYRVTKKGLWQQVVFRGKPNPVYQSCHSDTEGNELHIIHLLLDFSVSGRQAELF